MPKNTKRIRFTIDWPPAAEYVSVEPCTRCKGKTHVWRTPGHAVQEIRFCPACWKATADPGSLKMAKGA